MGARPTILRIGCCIGSAPVFINLKLIVPAAGGQLAISGRSNDTLPAPLSCISPDHSLLRSVTTAEDGRRPSFHLGECVILSNPRTASQTTVRANLSRVTAAWRGLQESQRAAWTTAASGVNSASRLGQSGPLTGQQLFNKINCTLAQFGQQQVEAPPARPQFPALAPQGLVITNASGVITLKLTCPIDPGENTIVRGSKPVSQGYGKFSDFRVLGMCPAPTQGSANITSLYTARYGVPRLARRCSSASTSWLMAGKTGR